MDALGARNGDVAPRPALPFGLLAYLGAGASMLVCYGKTLLLAVAAHLGFEDPQLNPHLQAVLMWSLGVVAIIGLYRDRRLHRRDYPLVLAVVGVLVIVITLYTRYEPVIEFSGYALLVIAALTNQNAMLLRLNREVELQAGQLAAQARRLDDLNKGLERRVAEQVEEIENLARLRRFLAPEVARLVTEGGQRHLLDSHRAFIVALFCDIRGFTGFSESREPEEVMDVLRVYHEHMGRLVAEHGGTIDHRAGDGLMLFFNDPIVIDEPVRRAVDLALEMRAAFDRLGAEWKKKGYRLGFGVGIASGYATLGVVGYEGRYDYTANGNAVNLAARLCDQAADGEILVSHHAFIDIEGQVRVRPVGERSLKGFSQPVPVYSIEPPADS